MVDIERICEKANEYYKKYGRTEKFAQLEKQIIATHNAIYIYTFARDVEGAIPSILGDEIIATKNPEYIYKFARDVNIGISTSEFTDAIIATGDAEYIYKFARDVKSNTLKLTNAIIATKNAYYIYYFARNIKDADRYKLARAIELTKDKMWIEKFKLDIGEEYFTYDDLSAEIEGIINSLK